MTQHESPDPNTVLRNELSAVAAALTAYLIQRRVLEERRWTRSVATVVFFLSMGFTYFGVNAFKSHDHAGAARRQPAVEMQRVALPNALPDTVKSRSADF